MIDFGDLRSGRRLIHSPTGRLVKVCGFVLGPRDDEGLRAVELRALTLEGEIVQGPPSAWERVCDD